MGTRYRGTAQEARALNAYITLVRASETVSGALARSLEASGLTLGQFGALEALLHLGPLCQRELGAKMLRSGGNITMIVRHLEKRGLVLRKRGEADRRYQTVSLTRAGERLVREVLPGHVAGIVRELSPLTAADQEELRRICRKVRRP
jgi:MarR family 2-MHQ and catechol resistance regulon transcriptional repressor